MRLARALLDGEGQACGSLIGVGAADLAQAQAIADADPFRAADVSERRTVQPWRLAFRGL